MTPLLKKSIVTYILDHFDEYQLVNATIKQFHPYVYIPEGDACKLLSR